MDPARSPTVENIRWGVRFGLILAVVLIAFISIGYLVRPNSPSHQAISWLAVSGSYLVSGLVCGLIVGVCRPLITSLSRSILLGPVIAFPFYAIVGIVIGNPFWRWDGVYWTIAIIASLIVGSIVGGMYWLIFTQARR
jgi:hypothetical protein